jgi:uncharacterized protein GlcG (DUF336 family)
MKIFLRSMALALICSVITTTAQAQVTTKRILTLEDAKQIIAIAETTAQHQHAPGGAIAIVDEGGHLILMERLNNTFAASANVSIGKARTADLFKRPTSFFENAINQGRTALVAMPDFTPLQGGVPIEMDGQIVGAIGVSGTASAQQDEEIALAGANGFKQP